MKWPSILHETWSLDPEKKQEEIYNQLGANEIDSKPWIRDFQALVRAFIVAYNSLQALTQYELFNKVSKNRDQDESDEKRC